MVGNKQWENSHGLLQGKFWCLERLKETPAKIQTKQAICITAARAPLVPVTLKIKFVWLLSFLHQYQWKVLSSEMWCQVVVNTKVLTAVLQEIQVGHYIALTDE